MTIHETPSKTGLTPFDATVDGGEFTAVASDAPGHHSSSSGTVFLAVNLALGALIALLATSESDSRTRAPEVSPHNTPVVITPRYDDPNVISDEQLQRVLYKVRPLLRSSSPNLNHLDHALRLWTARATFNDPDCLSGAEILGLLTDHRLLQQHWGNSTRPFLLAKTDLERPYVEFRTRSGPDSSSHVDHTLATLAEAGTPLDFPLQTEQGEFPLRAAFSYSFDSFRLNQAEPEWSALAFLHYLPDLRNWTTREGQTINWDMIASRLMRQKLTEGSCYGNHRLHTLACLLRVDEDTQILSTPARQKIIEHLRDVTQRLIASQHQDGYWTRRWPGEEWDGPSIGPHLPIDDRAQRILATGHALEWWALAPVETLPDRSHIVLAGQWLVATIDAMSRAEVKQSYTFLSHAGRALALWRGHFPADIYHPPQNQPANPDETNTTDSTAKSPRLEPSSIPPGDAAPSDGDTP